MYVGSFSSIVHGPQNETVFSHSAVTFSCNSDHASVIYWFYLLTDGSSVAIFDHRGRNVKLFDERFVNTVDNFTSNLTIHNVQKSDEGIYACRESSSERLWPARLEVIG